MSVFLQGPLADVQTGSNIPVCQIHLAVQREMTAFSQLGVQGTDWANKRDCCVRKKIWYSNQRRKQRNNK